MDVAAAAADYDARFLGRAALRSLDTPRAGG